MQKTIQWFLYSSANPEKIALTVKGVLVGVLPVLMLVTNLDGESANSFVNAIQNVVFYTLSAVSSIGVAYGFLRKIYLSFTK